MKPTICILAMLCPILSMCQPKPITGQVLNQDNEPIPAATVTLISNKQSAITNNNGIFTLNRVEEPGIPSHDSRLLTLDSITISAIGYETVTIAVTQLQTSNSKPQTIILPRKITALDEALIIAYGTTTKRFSTGSVAKLSASEIEKQPVSNPLSTLSGRIPGVIVTQGSGVTGSTVNVQIRGRTSLDLTLSKNDPLFIIDGVPFESGNTPVNQLTSAANNPVPTNNSPVSGISPFNTINPQDIESIEVLKDADATAIYGSRGANGVILITTRRGKAGKTKFAISSYTGFSSITHSPSMLSTEQYLQMRREAFANDGSTPTNSTAPDLLLWDTTQYTDFKKQFIGSTAQSSDINASISGGNAFTRFSIGAGYHRETNVFPGTHPDTRASFRLNLFHTPASKKWDINLVTIYASEKNRLFRTDLTRHIILPPHLQLFTSAGKYNWQQNGINFSTLGFTNPLAEMERTYNSLNQNLSSNLIINYKITAALILRVNMGYNTFNTTEQSNTPRTAIAPDNSTLASSLFATSTRSNWIIEPQAEYNAKLAKGKLELLLGTTFQQRNANGMNAAGTGYTNDLLLASLSAAASITASNTFEVYKYNALFGRITYNWQQKYLFNFSARRDGSSRFGPGRQFANFGALGLGWIFTTEPWMQNQNILSYGKLRTSYGITGNDQVGDYKYLDLWTNTSNPYQGIPGFRPLALFNPDYNWEKNKKWEAALELAFFNDKLSVSTAYYQHRSSNQLVSYRLPNQTGFATVVKNLPALVQNSGWEFTLQSMLTKKKGLHWKSLFNLTIPSNKLIAFPGLAGSSYNSLYTVGKSLSVVTALKFLGVDPSTGIYTYQDLNNDGALNAADLQNLGHLDPRWYAGWSNTIEFQQWQFDIFCEYRNQRGRNYLATLYNYKPGFLYNQPDLVLNRWYKPGMNSVIQKFTTANSTPAGQAGNRISASDAPYSDASFIRIKNIALAYNFSSTLAEKLKIEAARFFIQAQNFFTITNYKGSDPETQNFLQLPPLKTIVMGCQFTL